jgi:hypothetical protein
LVTAWWSQAVTNTSINHTQCCSTGAWYDHEKTRRGKNIRPFYRPAGYIIHSLVHISETGDEVLYMGVLNVNTAVSRHPRASCTRGYPDVFRSANRNMWVCAPAVLICLRTEEKAEVSRTMTSIRQLHSQQCYKVTVMANLKYSALHTHAILSQFHKPPTPTSYFLKIICTHKVAIRTTVLP